MTSRLPGISLLFLLVGNCMAQTTAKTMREPVRAPAFPSDAAWLNTSAPITIEQLRGQVVLLDFWTYCCINCMHVLPDLRYIEQKYRDKPVVVIGVHSGKFQQEKDAANIRAAILRHNISHPVIVDSDYTVWNAYAVHAWPTLVMIDPEGYLVGMTSGEGHREEIDRVIQMVLGEHEKKGTLAKPLHFRAEREGFKPGVLEFPGKVLADGAGKRLFISDTNHHRVLAGDLDGRISAVIGSGTAGLKDGGFAEAEFQQPQGMALSEDGQTLYVADTENHAIRAVDLKQGNVSTLAGDGKQGRDLAPRGAGARVELSSPWDLARVGEKLYIAMAGSHQLWWLDLKSRQIGLLAGTGREARTDGPNSSATFAQPSGLCSDGRYLFVADSEVSSIRMVGLGDDGRVSTLAGSGGLFDFGWKDGVGEDARFQHPLGVALAGGKLFVADTFNHRIRAVDISSGEVSTWIGGDAPDGAKPAQIGLYEPGGLSAAGDTLYVADTNNHRILAIDLKSRAVRPVHVRLP